MAPETTGNVQTDYKTMPVEEIVSELQARWENFKRQLPTSASGEVFQEAGQINHLIAALVEKTP